MSPLQPDIRENSPNGAGKPATTVLVVDDEALTRWSIAEVLGERGYSVMQCGDAASALQALASPGNVPDVVFLDLRLPDSSDLLALSVIHRFFPTIPIVLMTAHGSRELFDDARRRGAAAVVGKPFEIGELVPIVERVLAGRSL